MGLFRGTFMNTTKRFEVWWQALPGTLTQIAAVLTALAGLIGVLREFVPKVDSGEVPADLPVADGTYQIINVQSRRLLDADTTTLHQNGTKVQLYGTRHDGMDNRLWKIAKASDGGYFIFNRQNARLLDADTGTIQQDGTKVQLYGSAPDKMTNRQWNIQRAQGDSYFIVNVQSNRLLDADTGTIAVDGTTVQLYGQEGKENPNRQWKLVKVKAD